MKFSIKTIAKVFTDVIDQATISQIISILNQESLKTSKIRIMPDCHAGEGCVVGTTMTIANSNVIPNLIGVDIGCGMLAVKLREDTVDLPAFDEVIHTAVPSGPNVLDSAIQKNPELADLHCLTRKIHKIRLDLAEKAWVRWVEEIILLSSIEIARERFGWSFTPVPAILG